MKAVYCQPGGVLDYTPSKKIEAGQVVALGARIGVAAEDIAAGQTGGVHVEGVFSMPKGTTEAVAQGAALYYDEAADVVTATASTEVGEGQAKETVNNVPAGYAAASAAAGDGTVLVKLLG